MGILVHYMAGRNLCAWGYINRNFQNWKSNRKKKIRKKTKTELPKLWDNYKSYKVHITGIPYGEESKKGTE